MKNLLYICILFIAVSGCKTKTETEYKEVTAIRASDLYRNDSVYQYVQRNKNNYADLANEYLKKSKTAEENNLAMAVYFAKRAVTLNPTMENYKALAAMLEKAKNYDELGELYYLVTSKYYPDGADGFYIFGQPDEDLYREMMVCELLGRGAIDPETVYNAKELKLNLSKLKETVFADKRLKIDMTTPDAKNMLLQFLSDEELQAYNKLPSTFKDFLASIKDVAPVFEIDKKAVHEFDYADFNGMNDEEGYDSPTTSYVYQNFLKEKRDKPDEWFHYNFNHLLNVNDSVIGVIYAIDSSETACPVEMRHIYHRLVTYNKKANIISSQIVAIQSGEQLTTASFNFNKFTVTESKRSWKHPYEKTDFDNYITGTEKVKETSYEIQPNGKIIQL
ncbi:MAG: hypothetical protein JWP12_2741 [Bacteroidetes bacterium]|nr:hypothetical protein [Bacteroidota bacterium]